MCRRIFPVPCYVHGFIRLPEHRRAPVFVLDTVTRTRNGGGWTQPAGENFAAGMYWHSRQQLPGDQPFDRNYDSFIRSNVVLSAMRTFGTLKHCLARLVV
jgi:hypothetical protein